MITTEQQKEVLNALNTAQAILINDDDTDKDIKSIVGGLIHDVYDMETEN